MISHVSRLGIETMLVFVLLLPSAATAQQVAMIGITDAEVADSMRSYRYSNDVVKALTKATADSLYATRKFEVMSRASAGKV